MHAYNRAQKAQQLYMKPETVNESCREDLQYTSYIVYYKPYTCMHLLSTRGCSYFRTYPVFPGSCLNQQAKLKPSGAANPLNEAAGMKIEEFEEISAEERVEPGRLGPVNVA